VSTYASGTSVSVERSRAEIESVLARYGAQSFAYMNNQAQAMIFFEAHGKGVKFVLPLPERAAFRTREKYKKQVEQSPEAQYRDWEQACRERWRSLALCIKAKLETVRSGISSFETEFLPHFVIGPKGQTLGDKIIPQLEEATRSGKMPLLLG
jgi:hypothetical protein